MEPVPGTYEAKECPLTTATGISSAAKRVSRSAPQAPTLSGGVPASLRPCKRWSTSSAPEFGLASTGRLKIRPSSPLNRGFREGAPASGQVPPSGTIIRWFGVATKTCPLRSLGDGSASTLIPFQPENTVITSFACARAVGGATALFPLPHEGWNPILSEERPCCQGTKESMEATCPLRA